VDTTGRYTTEEVEEEIDNQTIDIYDEIGTPLEAMYSVVDKYSGLDDFYLEYNLGDPHVYQVERVFVGTVTKRELEEGVDYDVAKKVGMIKLTSSTVGGSRLDSADDIIIQYVPEIYRTYCALLTSVALLEKLDFITSGKPSKELEAAEARLAKHEQKMRERIGINLSGDYRYFDEVYGVNNKKVTQDHDKNLFLYREDSIDN